ncbi:DEKNAAC102728 [Brettanomyces naardenensis]|uniref:Mitochondrial intermembrane space import and assembly protein 40 n=1 Tax=Brettanomyces naardenensis TaxID=13370 RepID=A0A448YKX5_BRENA|nr:DEKNAAC102728 [Brettanomyces naardenensis]
MFARVVRQSARASARCAKGTRLSARRLYNTQQEQGQFSRYGLWVAGGSAVAVIGLLGYRASGLSEERSVLEPVKTVEKKVTEEIKVEEVPVEPAEPVELAGPVEPIQAAETTGSKPDEPTLSPEPAEPVQPAPSTETSFPSQPATAAEPSVPTPSVSAVLEQPVQTSEPIEVASSVAAAATVIKPLEPVKEAKKEPVKPSEPVQESKGNKEKELGKPKEVKPATQKPSVAASAEPEEQKEAYDPDTGEINWDCPCLGGMADGPCGEEFKAAFSCFVYSKEEPKGIECIDKFKDMQNCFRRYPDVYAEELRDDDDYGDVSAEPEAPIVTPADAPEEVVRQEVEKVKADASDLKDEAVETLEFTQSKVSEGIDSAKRTLSETQEQLGQKIEAAKETAADRIEATSAEIEARQAYLEAKAQEEARIAQAKAENARQYTEASLSQAPDAAKNTFEHTKETAESLVDSAKDEIKGEAQKVQKRVSGKD